MARRALVWRGLDMPLMEIAHVELDEDALRARGTQIGVAYELRYELEPGGLRAHVVDGPSLDIGLDDGTDFFDLGHSPLFNSLPVLGGLDTVTDFVMTFVHVPSLEVSRAEQRYEPLGDGVVRFRSGTFVADIAFDADGFVTRYEGLAERVG
jgi:uncharacterized protein